MKKILLYLSILLIIFIYSCFPIGKMTSCNCKGTLNFATIKHNGFYYTDILNRYKEDKAGKIPIFKMFLFSNGVILKEGVSDNLEEAMSVRPIQDRGFVKEYKSDWACFTIKDSIIKMQDFYEKGGGFFGIRKYDGKIINDTTFILQKFYTDKYEKWQDALFHFKASLKPDSVNWLIKEKCK